MSRGAYARAVAQMRQMEARPRAASAPIWKFIGPQPMNNVQANFAGAAPGASFEATGRVSALAADPTTPGRLFVCAAGGGVWLSTDGGQTFAPIFDSEPTQAIGAIALDSVNANPPAIYVGTGEGDGGDSYYGQGIFRSTDLGASWTALSPGTFDRMSVAKLALDTSTNPPTIFAAITGGASFGRADPRLIESDSAQQGLWRSTDGGVSWTQYPAATFQCMLGSGAPCPAEDVAIDPLNPANVYVSIKYDDVFVSTDAGATFSATCFTNDAPCSFPLGIDQIDRASLSIGPPAPDAPLFCSGGTEPCGIVYAMVGLLDQGEYAGLFLSTDGGLTWSQRVVPSFSTSAATLDGTLAGNFSDEAYDQALLVSPDDPTTVLFGGVGIYQSTDAGASWAFLARNGGVQSGQHALAIAPDGDTVYVGNDGGAYRFSLSAIINSAASFASLNATLNAGLVQALGPHPKNSERLLAGFDDNGTQLYAGTPGWNSVASRAGGFVLFDRVNPSFAYRDSASAAGIAGKLTMIDLGVSSDGGRSFTDTKLDLSGRDPGFAWYPPLAADPARAHRVLFGGHFVWVWHPTTERYSRQSARDLTGGCGDGSCALQDIEFAPSDHRKAWALSMQSGTAPFKLFNTVHADRNRAVRWNDVTAALPFETAATQATGIAPDPRNPRRALLSVSGFTAATGVGHIFSTTDFGASWRRADGAGGPSPLPDIPVLRLLVDRTDRRGATLYAATDIGVFRSTDAGASWSAFNLGAIPAVPVFDIEQNSAGTIFAGTHGRGAYQLLLPTPPRGRR